MRGAPPETLESPEVTESVSHGPLHLFPLVGGTTPAEEGVALFDEALEAGALRMEELGEGGSARELRGVVVALGEKPVLLEVLAGSRSFARVFRRLLAGYALAALEHAGDGERSPPSLAKSFVAGVAAALQERHAAVGEGEDVRFEAQGTSGYALVADGEVLHAAAFAG